MPYRTVNCFLASLRKPSLPFAPGSSIFSHSVFNYSSCKPLTPCLDSLPASGWPDSPESQPIVHVPNIAFGRSPDTARTHAAQAPLQPRFTGFTYKWCDPTVESMSEASINLRQWGGVITVEL